MKPFHFCLLLGTSLVARAADLPSPRDVLTEAARGRGALSEVVGDLNRGIADVDNRTTLFGYLMILDELEKISARYDFATSGGNPVDGLSKLVTRHAVKWMFLDQVEWPVVETFFRRADEGSRYNLVAQQFGRVQMESTKAGLWRWQGLVRKLWELTGQVKGQLALGERVDELASLITRRLLTHPEGLKVNELNDLVAETRTPAALSELLSLFTKRTADAKSPEAIEELLFQTIAIRRQQRAFENLLATSALAQPGSLGLMLTLRLLERNAVPTRVSSTELGALWNDQQHVELAESLAALYSVTPPSKETADFVWQLAEQAAQGLERAGSLHRLTEFKKFLSGLAATRVIAQEAFEGTYRVEIGDAGRGDTIQKAILTVAAVGGSQFILGLNVLSPDGGQSQWGNDYNFFDVVWDSKNAGYVAQYRAVESPRFVFRPEDLYQLKFSLQRREGKSVIEGTFFDGRRPSVYRKLSGELFEAYPVYSAVLGADSSSDFTGVFRAAATKSDPSLEVIVTKTGSAVGGKYFYDYFLADVPFEWGHFNPHRRGLFLTSGEFNGSRKWAHLRGQLSADGRLLKATYILSGRGIQREFTLDRIER